MSSKIAPKNESVCEHQPPNRLVLTGFMGSGKTTVGRLVAARLGWRFVDVDEAIEQQEGRRVSAIFAESGEAAFRRLETLALDALLREEQIVIALGGGALETPANRDLLASAPRTIVVLLSAPFAVLYERCVQQNAAAIASGDPVRPLLGSPESAASRLARRENAYRAAAGLVIDSSEQTPEDTAESLYQAVACGL